MRKRVQGKKALVAKTQNYGLWSVLALAGLSLVGSWLICRMITKAEKL